MDWRIGAFFVVVFILIAIAKLLGRKPTTNYPYRIKGKLFSEAERSFFGVLSQAAGENFVVMAKVRVADILAPDRGLPKPAWRSAFNKISSKHFDYVLCDPSTLAVSCVVELNDKSHKSMKRAKRDEFLRGACMSAGLRLVEVTAKSKYSVNEVKRIIAAPRDNQDETIRVEPRF